MTGDIGSDTPLRLAAAVALAFPQGGMTVSGLRREAARGRLVIMRIAGKDWVTLSAIREMMDKCRVVREVPISGCARPSQTERQPDGSLSTVDAKLAQDALRLKLEKLKESYRNTSSRSMRHPAASVISLKSR